MQLNNEVRWLPQQEDTFLAANGSQEINTINATISVVNAYKAMRSKWLRYVDIIFWPQVRATEEDCTRPFDHGQAPSQRVFNVFTAFGAQGRVEPSLLRTVMDVDPPEDEAMAAFKYHLKEVICAGNESKYQRVLLWFAHIIQRPHEKT